MTRYGTILVSTLTLLALVSACSSPLSDDDNGAATPALTTPSPTATPEPAAPTENSADGALTEVEASAVRATVTPSVDPTAPLRGSATAPPTATAEPLPSDGAELRIGGQAITMIYAGNESGRTMYAVAGEQFWRTNDGGQSWSAAGDGHIGGVIVALNEQNVVYAGDRGGCGRGFSFHDFRRSTDAGRTWESIDANADLAPLLAYEARDFAVVYATNCGLRVSTDGGTTWELVPDLNGEDIFAVATERTDPMQQLLVVAATEGGTGRLFLLDSTDPGRPLFLGALAQYWGDAAIDWNDGRIVLAHAHQVGVSDDGGQTWAWSRTGLGEATFSVDPLFESIPETEMDPFRRFNIVLIDPTNRDRIWLGGTRGAFLSIDGGLTWERVGDDVEVTGIAISTLSERVLISSANGTRLWALESS